MCYKPSILILESGARQEISCGKCGRCAQRRINDYVGRSLCEASLSRAACCITLSYRNDFDGGRYDLADKILTPHHFQLFMKRLRKGGHKCKYLVAGEYGDKKGRAHFHVLIFFRASQPDWIHGKSHIPEWPHGHVVVDWNIDHRAARYVCKYLHKDLQKGSGQKWLSMSKRPALGAEWFYAKAQNHIKQRVFPTSFAYQPPGAAPGQKHLMQGAIKRDFIKAISDGWHGPLPVEKANEWVKRAVSTYRLGQFKRLIEAYQKDHQEEAAEALNEEILARQGPEMKLHELERLDRRNEARVRIAMSVLNHPDDPLNAEYLEWLRKQSPAEHAALTREIRDNRRAKKLADRKQLLQLFKRLGALLPRQAPED